MSRWSIRTISQTETTVKLLFTCCDCEKKRPKSEAPPPQCYFSSQGMAAGEDRECKEGMTSLLRSQTKASALLWTQGTKEGAGKEARSRKIQSGFKCLSLPKISEWISLHINPY